MSYDHKAVEKKWQDRWKETGLYEVSEDSSKEKEYLLIEFPYPSGAGLHVGHVRSYTAMDVIARKRRAEGKNVLYPIGWDAFGLPTENYAVKTGVHPKIVTKENTDNFRRQLQSLGFSFDWSREINTTDPSYYKWTQWIFLKLYEKGLAYKSCMPINWCLDCKIGLANEEVVDGVCERCGGSVEKREKEQWMLKITEYADRLHDDLDHVEYWDRIKTQQRNWIGRSTGSALSFPVKDSDLKIDVFTTRPDTLFGATYMVLAPEHPLIAKLKENIDNYKEVSAYITKTTEQTDIERTAENKEKTGVVLEGIRAINPATNEEIPVFIADYVLMHYGTGAIMAVPAHDERDLAFAQKYDVSVVTVVKTDKEVSFPYTGEGILENSGEFNGMSTEEAREKITVYVGGKTTTSYKLRDWIFSRQRYWGEPIPMVKCDSCGWVPVPESELPVELPDVEKYEPTDSGESPLAAVPEWIETTCPSCKGPAQRETDTMPNWAGSSWYYLRYADPHNDTALASEDNLKYWTPVDWYNGGMEHTTLHLLYSRFWHKVLYDLGVVPTDEPYMKRTSHGIVLAEGGEKMSKSKGNVVNPDDVINHVGADTLRMYEMFMGPFDQQIAWDTNNMVGSRRFLERVWRLKDACTDTHSESVESVLHQTIKKVGEDIDNLKFNTAISALMQFINLAEKESLSKEGYAIVLRLLSPFAPHITEELWHVLGNEGSVHQETWPLFDEEKMHVAEVTIAVQVNGKVRGSVVVPHDSDQKAVEDAVEGVENVTKHTEGKEIVNVVFVPNKILNIVVRDG